MVPQNARASMCKRHRLAKCYSNVLPYTVRTKRSRGIKLDLLLLRYYSLLFAEQMLRSFLNPLKTLSANFTIHPSSRSPPNKLFILLVPQNPRASMRKKHQLTRSSSNILPKGRGAFQGWHLNSSVSRCCSWLFLFTSSGGSWSPHVFVVFLYDLFLTFPLQIFLRHPRGSAKVTKRLFCFGDSSLIINYQKAAAISPESKRAKVSLLQLLNKESTICLNPFDDFWLPFLSPLFVHSFD